MFIAPQAKLLFIHVNKTAGEAITEYLAAHVGDPHAVKLYEGSGGVTVGGRYYPGLGKHSKARQLRRTIAEYDDYLTFCFARNPWDRAASWYEYLRRGVGLPYMGTAGSVAMHEAVRRIAERRVATPEMNEAALSPFGDFIRNPITLQRFADQSVISYAFDGDTRIVTYIGRFENLEIDFGEICRRAGIAAGHLPTVNSSKKRPYQDYYTQADVQVIADVWGQDAELMGYQF